MRSPFYRGSFIENFKDILHPAVDWFGVFTAREALEAFEKTRK
jgi:hypothetical protein